MAAYGHLVLETHQWTVKYSGSTNYESRLTPGPARRRIYRITKTVTETPWSKAKRSGAESHERQELELVTIESHETQTEVFKPRYDGPTRSTQCRFTFFQI